jgi:hypothetical protein
VLTWSRLAVLGAIIVARTATALAQSGAPLNSTTAVADPADRTGTNPANLRTTLEVSNDFRSIDDELFADQVTWRYAQSFASDRMRARVELPLSFANITGRTEAGFGDVVAGWEWLAVVRRRTAWLTGVDLAFDSGTNPALATRHNVLTPSAGFAFLPRRDTVVSVRYIQRLSLESVADWPDINKGTLEATIVRRFGEWMWIRALPSLVSDYESNDVSGRLDGEWGRLLAPGASTWVRGGGAIGSRESRWFDWRLEIGFRFVQ